MNRFSVVLVLGLTLTVVATVCYKWGDGNRRPQHPLVVIGIDGGEWNVIEPMIAEGALPNIASLVESGISGHLINPGPEISPPVWTTFATGHFPRHHGVLDHVYPYYDTNAKFPVNATLRLKPALWNVASANGLKSTVVGYFVTWPAEPINGTIVSDEAFQGLDDSISPAEVEQEYEEIFAPLRNQESWIQVLMPYFPWGYRRDQADDESDPNYEASSQIRYRVDRLLVKDEATRQVVRRAAKNGEELFVVYYRSPDLVSHSFWKYFDDSTYSQKPTAEMREKLGRAVPESYRFVDRAIGELIERFGEDANFVIVSDHGFRPVEEQIIDSGHYQWELTGNHRLNGIFIASGPDIASGSIEMLTTLDIMPTVAYLLCLPVSDELPGRVDFRVVVPEFEKRCPLRTVGSYTLHAAITEPDSSSLDDQQATMEELRGLGYVGANINLGSAEGTPDYDFWVSAGMTIANHLSGELVFHLIRNNSSAAINLITELRGKRPDLELKLRDYTVSRLTRLSEDLPEKPPLIELLNAFDDAHDIGWFD